MFTFKKKQTATTLEKIPNHIGIIMDGNGRWAKKRLQPRVFGHKAGMDALQDVTIAASDLGVKVLTVYAFSTENWSRPDDEVSFIMNLPVEFFDKYVPKLHENNVRVQVIGELAHLPEATLDAMNLNDQASAGKAQAVRENGASRQAPKRSKVSSYDLSCWQGLWQRRPHCRGCDYRLRWRDFSRAD